MLSVDLRGVASKATSAARSRYANGSGHSYLFGAGRHSRQLPHAATCWLTAYGQGSVGYGRSNYGVLTNAQTNEYDHCQACTDAG